MGIITNRVKHGSKNTIIYTLVSTTLVIENTALFEQHCEFRNILDTKQQVSGTDFQVYRCCNHNLTVVERSRVLTGSPHGLAQGLATN